MSPQPSPLRLEPIHEGLGEQAAKVRLIDMTRGGRSLGRIIPSVLRQFADPQPSECRVRIIGEPIWQGRSAVEYPACVQHEALINAAFTGRAVAILCPCDAGQMEKQILSDALATHPVVIDADGQSRVGTPVGEGGTWNVLGLELRSDEAGQSASVNAAGT